MAQRKPPSPPTYKHRETLTFKGLTYRYDKPFATWSLVDKPPPRNVPRTLYATHEGWGVDSLLKAADTPEGALRTWLASLIDLRQREVQEAAEGLKRARDEVRRLKARNLKT